MSKPHLHIGLIGGGAHIMSLTTAAITAAQIENPDKEITIESIPADMYQESTAIETHDDTSTVSYPWAYNYQPTLNVFLDMKKRRRNKTSTPSQRQKRKAVRRKNSTKRKK